MKSMSEQLKDMEKAFKTYSINTDIATNAGLEAACILVQRNAIILSPVDTGLLRKSILRRIVKAPKGYNGEVGTNVEYAPFQEFGVQSRNIPPQPFLTPALNMNKANIRALLAKAISGVKA